MQYSDITPRQTAYSIAGLLKRALPLMVLERFGQQYPLPKNNTDTAKFRRYFLQGSTGSISGEVSGTPAGTKYGVPLALTPLVEGVTPAGRELRSKDYTVQLLQYGDYIEFTDVMIDLHEDMPPLMRELVGILGEQAAMTTETLRFNVLKAGTNVYYANGSARNAVNTPLSLTLQRKVTRALKRQNAMPLTQVLKSSTAYNTQPIEAAYIGIVHPDVENDIRDMQGFISTKHYASVTPMDGEIGSVEDVRYVRSTVIAPWEDAGGAATGGGSPAVPVLSTSSTNADVYPVLFIAKDAYGIVPLRGAPTGGSFATPVNVMVVQPKATTTDPLAQRGTAGWKAWNATVILNDFFIVRAEVAATA